jgi:hypothetical protein
VEMLSAIKRMWFNLLSSQDCVIIQPLHSATAGRETRPTDGLLSCFSPCLVCHTKHKHCV